jgi:hypothetical protein
MDEGGMGAVHEAEQESPHRIVALKVFRAGYTTGEMLRPFRERDAGAGPPAASGNCADLRRWHGGGAVWTAAAFRDGAGAGRERCSGTATSTSFR